MEILNHIESPLESNSNKQFETVLAALQTYTKSWPVIEPIYACPFDGEAYWIARYSHGQNWITFHSSKSRVVISIHSKRDFVSYADGVAVDQLNTFLRKTIPNTKWRIKQIEGGR